MDFLPPVTASVGPAGEAELIAPAPEGAYACLFSSGAKGGRFTALDASSGDSRRADEIDVPWDPRDRPLGLAITWSLSGELCVLAIDGARAAAFDFAAGVAYLSDGAAQDATRRPLSDLIERLAPEAPNFD